MAAMERKNGSTTTTFRMTRPEREAVQAAAGSLGIGVSSFARVATIRAADLTPASPPRREKVTVVIDPVLRALGPIGSNLNQLARVANSTGSAAAIVSAGHLLIEFQRLTRAVISLGGPSH
ncbi:plasmid mobilization protein [Rhodopseudomonas sp. RCAM05734]|uniref:plasmid mobilization protein n=1 Tax=Rhodopseudomonas sp. RCAM05734 TaxID=3457549 RepID=UPI0040439B71